MKTQKHHLRHRLIIAAVMASGITSTAIAADGTWTADTTPLLWSGTGNWASGTVADGSGSTANFTNNITGDRVVNIDADKTITNIVFGDSDTSSAGSWTIGNNGVSTNNLILAGTTPTITVNALGTNKTATISAIIEGTSGLTKAGVGTLVLSGTNTYTGLTTISAGKLQVASNVIGSSSGFSIGNMATLESSAGFTLTANQSVTGTGATGVVTTSAATGLITTSGTTISASDTLTITRLSILGTGNQITGGNIQSGGSGASQRGLLVGNGGAGTLTITGGSLTTNGVTANSGFDILGNQGSNTGTLILNGGSYTNTTSKLSLGNGSTTNGILTITSGSATIADIEYNAGNTGTVNLDGGTLTISKITSTAGTKIFNFNGGQFIAGAALPTISGVTLNVKDGGAKINTNGFSFTISDAMVNGGTGIGGLTKTGAGTLTLSSTTNGYTGATTVSAGTLALTGALSSSSALAVGGATFSYDRSGTNEQTVAGLTVNAGKATVNNTVVTNTLNLGTITRASGNGVLNFASTTGAISTTKQNTNGIIGPWALFGGTKYAVGSADGSTVTTITGLTGTTQESEANWTDNTANYEVSTTTGQTLSGNRTGNTFRYSGTGLTIGLGASGSNTFTTNGILAVGASGTLTISRAGGTGTVVAGSTGEIVIAGSQAVTISAPISSGVVTYGGTGTLTLSGANTYSGGTYINSGTVSLGVASSPTSGTVTIGPVGTGSVYLAGGTLKTNNFTIANNIVAVANTFSIIDSTSNATLNGNLSGSGTITKTSANQVVLGGNNSTFSGTFTEAGTGPLSFLTSNSGSASGKWVQGAASTWVAGTAGITVKLGELSSTVTTGTVRGGSGLADGSQVTFEVGALGTNATYSGKIQDYTTGKQVTSNVTKVGSGTWTLSGSNTYIGDTKVNEGTLIATQANTAFAPASKLSVASGATFQAGGTNLWGNNGSLIGAWTIGGRFKVNGAFNITMPTSVTLNGGTLTTTADEAVYGNFLNGAGTSITANGTGNAISARIGMFSNITFNTPLSGDALNVSAVLGATNASPSGTSGGLTKSGAGTVTISGANTYSGATIVNGGVLNVTGSTAAGSAVAVGGASATGTPKLAGSGTIHGAVTVKSAGGGVVGVLDAGDAGSSNPAGKLTVNNNLTFESGSIFEWDIKDGTTMSENAGDRGVQYDAVDMTGALSVTSGVFRVVLNLGQFNSGGFWDSNRTWASTSIFNVGGSLAGFSTLEWYEGSTLMGQSSNLSGRSTDGYFTISGTNLTWTAVPEPTSALAGLLLFGGLMRRRRSVCPG